jgi:hypothetical protein
MITDIDFNGVQTSPIQSFKPIFNGTDVVRLGVRIKWDNLTDTCLFGWFLYDEDKNILLSGDQQCTRSDYQEWNGDNNFPFSFVGNKLGLIFI